MTAILNPRYPEPQTWMRLGHPERLYGTILISDLAEMEIPSLLALTSEGLS